MLGQAKPTQGNYLDIVRTVVSESEVNPFAYALDKSHLATLCCIMYPLHGIFLHYQTLNVRKLIQYCTFSSDPLIEVLG